MENTSGNRPGFPRTMFLIALLITLGAALAALQTSEPVREAFGLDPIIEGLPPRTLWTSHLPTGPLDGAVALLPSSATNVRHESTTVRRLGNGTQRAPPHPGPGSVRPGHDPAGRLRGSPRRGGRHRRLLRLALGLSRVTRHTETARCSET